MRFTRRELKKEKKNLYRKTYIAVNYFQIISSITFLYHFCNPIFSHYMPFEPAVRVLLCVIFVVFMSIIFFWLCETVREESLKCTKKKKKNGFRGIEIESSDREFIFISCHSQKWTWMERAWFR